MPRNDILERKNEILEWIKANKSKAFICRELHCKPETLNSYLTKMGIQYAGNQGRKGFSHSEDSSTNYKTAEEYIQGTTVKSSILKEKLFRDGIKERKCEICNISEWQGQLVPLELHHIDGNHYNNELSNLQVLCPNCHAQQNNNSGKNCGKNIIQKDKKLLNYCCDCGAIISASATRCKSCSVKARAKDNRVVKDRPDRQELKNLIRNNSFLSLSDKFGVSDNAIRKWCISYNLPSRKTDINKIPDDEWALI